MLPERAHIGHIVQNSSSPGDEGFVIQSVQFDTVDTPTTAPWLHGVPDPSGVTDPVDLQGNTINIR